MTKSYAGFGAFETTNKNGVQGSFVALAGSLPSIKEALQHFGRDAQPSESAEVVEKVDVESEVGRGIWAFYSQLKSYYEVAEVVEIIPQSFVNNFFKQEIQEHARANFARVDQQDEVRIYGLDEVELTYINRKLDRWDAISDGFRKLPASILLSLVAGFDSAFADFAKVLLRSRPERYEGSDRQYTVSEILKLDSLEQLINKAADDEIDGLMNKSHTDQVAFFEKSFGVSIKEHYERWPEFVEVFERRNLAAHGSLRVNDRYIENCKRAGLKSSVKVGEYLEVNDIYLKQSIDILVEFGILLALSAWQKQYPKSILESFGAVVEVSYSLLKDNHPHVAARILEYGLRVKSKGADEEKVKMMTINLAIAHKQGGDPDRCDEILSRTDWSASPPQFRLCCVAVKGEAHLAAGLLEAAKVSENLSPFQVREWPAFQWVRDNEEFRLACEACFGEPLFPTKLVNANSALVEEEGKAEKVPLD